MFTDLLDNELGVPKIASRDSGFEYRYNCPFCEPNNKYKFYVRVDENHEKNNLWHCFKCGESGNPISFAMKYYQVGFQESLDILEEYDYRFENRDYVPKDDTLTDEEYIILVMTSPPTAKEAVSAKIYVPPRLPSSYKRLWDNLRNPEAYPFLLYAHQRNFTLEDIYTHNIGYVTDADVPLPSGKQIHLHNHLVFLTHGDDGCYQYWNTRAIGDSYVKSFNAPSNDGEYSKRNTVFNLNRAKLTPYIVICEGVPDALTVGQSGVGTFGKQVTMEQVDLIVKDLQPEQKIYIFLDRDAKEQTGTLAERLYKKHKETYIVLNPTFDDANKMGREKAWDVINNHSVVADALGLIQLRL